MIGRRIADALIEAPIVTSFTRIGYEARKRLDRWSSLDDYDLSGQVIVLTGATSGLGYAAARQLAKCGATLVLVGRSAPSEAAQLAIAELQQRVEQELGRLAVDTWRLPEVAVAQAGCSSAAMK